MKLTQTTTPVHSKASQIAQRWDVHIRNQYKLTGLCLFAQIWLSHSLFLTERVSTAAYLSLLLSGIPFSLVYLLSRTLSRRTKSAKSTLTAWLPRPLGRTMEIFIAFSLLMDAIFILCGLASLLSEMLPTFRRFTIAPTIAILCALAQVHNRPYAIVHLGGLLFFPTLALLLLSASPALQQGNIHHFFPILCDSAQSVWTGALWLTGILGCACIPHLLPDEAEALERIRKKESHQGKAFILVGFLCALLIISAYTYILPPYALAAARSMGTRLLLPAQISSSVLGWTLYVCLLILILLITYSATVSRCGIFLCGTCTQQKAAPDKITLLLFLLTLPPAMFYAQSVQVWLINLLPFRAVPFILSILTAWISAAIHYVRERRHP